MIQIPPELRREIDILKATVARLEVELATVDHRIRSQVDGSIKTMVDAIEKHVVTVISRELQETRLQLLKIDKVLELAEKASTWQESIRRVEIHEEAKRLKDVEVAAEDAVFARHLEMASRAVDIQAKKAEIHLKHKDSQIKEEVVLDSRIDGNHKRKIAILTVVISIVSLGITGGACSAFSHFSRANNSESKGK